LISRERVDGTAVVHITVKGKALLAAAGRDAMPRA